MKISCFLKGAATVLAVTTTVSVFQIPVAHADVCVTVDSTTVRLDPRSAAGPDGTCIATSGSCYVQPFENNANVTIGWVCVDDVVHSFVAEPRPLLDPDVSETLPAQELDELQAAEHAADERAENLEYESGLVVQSSEECGVDYCARKINNFIWRVDATVSYGIGSREIGRIRVWAKASTNGRNVTSEWQSDPLAGPRTYDYVAFHCEDTNGWRPSSSCGSDRDNSGGFHSSHWYTYNRYYLSDDDDYHFHWLYSFHAEGYRNPSSGSGMFYVAPFRSDKLKCRKGYRAGECQFR